MCSSDGKVSRSLSLSDKVKVVQELELPGVTQASVAKKYGVSTSQVLRLAKNKKELLRAFECGAYPKRKQKREGALCMWLEQKLDQGACLSGPVLKKKASDLVRTQGTKFMPSDGWLSPWKARHNIVFKKEHGEKADTNLPLASD